MQFKIPQNVQIEDKIVGPLTLKQLAIMGFGGGISYAIYISLAKTHGIIIWLPATAIPALLTLAFTFLKINGIVFYKWIFLSFEYFYIPRKRNFVMGAADIYSATIFSQDDKEQKVDPSIKTKADENQEKMKHLSEITKIVDSKKL